MKKILLRMGDLVGLPFIEPLVKLASWEEPRAQLRSLFIYVGMPTIAFAVFLGLWQFASGKIQTNYGTLPTPNDVWLAGRQLMSRHYETKSKESEFYRDNEQAAREYRTEAIALITEAKQTTGAKKSSLIKEAATLERKAKLQSERRFSSAPTFLDQIQTSLVTVFTGFILATLIAVPLGILCGVSKSFMAAMNPLIQIFKPVSPLAWLPIVMICVGALYTSDPNEAWFSKSFISSAVTVALCSLWPTMVNTALGVASIDKDYINVARVLKLGFWTRLRKIIIPASLPLVFTGLRISLGVGWMVLIAAEMLAQNPGLGKFVWDMFQNGSSQTLAQIMVAVFVIGFLGFLLDRMMVIFQRSVSYGTVASA